MLWKVVLICYISAVTCWSYALSHIPEDWKVVNTTQGPVRGYRDNDTEVFVFYSIAYAATPKGVNKFKAPLPPPTWSETFEAIDKRIICPQFPTLPTDMFQMTEDCLITNIFIPDTQETNLPVLVIIHGGGFQIGFGNSMTPKSLVSSKKIIAITFNYRLGIHGFLCLGTESAPGNAGMKDQIALLRWVKNNIAQFGGNPKDVTVTGCSAGGASADLMILSKLTDGLMMKVLPESGSSLSTFGVQLNPVENAKLTALRLNFSNIGTINDLEKIYTSLSFEDMLKFSFMDSKDGTIEFVPCVEKNIGQEMFLEDAPINILKNRNFKALPMYIGFANFEGLYVISNFEYWKNIMNERFSIFLPSDLKFENDVEKQAVAKEVKEFYFGDKDVSNETILSYVEYFSDAMFFYSILQNVKLQVKAGNNALYLYEYSFVHNNTPSIPYTDVRGVNHCEQCFTVMDEDERNLPDDYIAMKATLRELWLNFIITGNPTPATWNSTLPRWPPVADVTRSPHYSIGNIIQVAGPLVERRALFWDEIYDKYYRTPIPPTNAAKELDAFKNYIFAFVISLLVIN